jgi:hypothetical protein
MSMPCGERGDIGHGVVRTVFACLYEYTSSTFSAAPILTLSEPKLLRYDKSLRSKGVPEMIRHLA